MAAGRSTLGANTSGKTGALVVRESGGRCSQARPYLFFSSVPCRLAGSLELSGCLTRIRAP